MGVHGAQPAADSGLPAGEAGTEAGAGRVAGFGELAAQRPDGATAAVKVTDDPIAPFTQRLEAVEGGKDGSLAP